MTPKEILDKLCESDNPCESLLLVAALDYAVCMEAVGPLVEIVTTK